MSGYCPAGKCECENKITLLYGSGVLIDACKLNQRLTEGSLKLYDVCPWPSRQVRVEPQGDCDKCPKDDAYAAGRLAGMQEAMEAVHAAGRLAGLQEAMEAVANIRLRFDSDTPGNVDLTLPEFQWVRDKAIAAIDRLMGGK
jgi:hypothetical protein